MEWSQESLQNPEPAEPKPESLPGRRASVRPARNGRRMIFAGRSAKRSPERYHLPARLSGETDMGIRTFCHWRLWRGFAAAPHAHARAVRVRPHGEVGRGMARCAGPSQSLRVFSLASVSAPLCRRCGGVGQPRLRLRLGGQPIATCPMSAPANANVGGLSWSASRRVEIALPEIKPDARQIAEGGPVDIDIDTGGE